ncbi:MAG: sigma 54-interacting transcriptional regulator, partial [Kofleriaceae bacterium]|nr:sigma 54-interacting transcriptional regulator [Kofleriaceae bacterium]
AFAEFSAGRSSEALAITGLSGSGRTRTMEEALLLHRIDAAKKSRAPLSLVRLPEEQLNSDPQATIDSYAQSDTKQVLWIRDDGSGGFLRFVACTVPSHVMLVLCHEPTVSQHTRTVHLPALQRQEFDDLCAGLAVHEIAPEWLSQLFALTQGQIGQTVEAMRLAAILDENYENPPDMLLAHGELKAALVKRVESLAPDARALLEFLAVAGEGMSYAEVAQGAEVTVPLCFQIVETLQQVGFALVRDASIQIASPAYATSIDGALGTKRRRDLHRQALAVRQELSAQEEFRHLLVVGPKAKARKAARRAIALKTSQQRYGEALALARQAQPLMTKEPETHALCIAMLARYTGDFALALTCAESACKASDPVTAGRAQFELARVKAYTGKLNESEQELRGILDTAPGDAEVGAELAAVLFKKGELQAAETEAQKWAQSQEFLAQVVAQEVLGLAKFYGGQYAEAHGHFDIILTSSQNVRDRRVLGRAHGLLGMVAQQEGDLKRSARYYTEGAQLSASCGAHHTAAVFRLNGATVEQRSAHYANALDSYEFARRSIEASGTPGQLAAVSWNRGNTLLSLGELSAAQVEAVQAQRIAADGKDSRILFFAQLLHGDLCAREGKHEKAEEWYREAATTASKSGLADGFYAEIHQAENACLAGRGSGTLPACLENRTDADIASSGDTINAEYLACEARIRLQFGAADRDLSDRLHQSVEALSESDDLDMGWRIAVLAARVLAQIGDASNLKQAVDRAQSLFDMVESRSPEAYRSGLRSHPDARALVGLSAEPARRDTEGSSPLPLRRLLALSRRLNSELRVDVLLAEIIDTAVELGQAERAFLLLRDSEGGLTIRVARNMSQGALGASEELSRSIAEKVARTGEVVMTVDAGEDSRFDSSKSIAALQLRSILAVPLRVRNRVVGTLYLDHRFRRGAFTNDAVALVCELADVAAVAIENARLSAENVKRQREIDALNLRLATKLEATEAELVVVRSQLPASRPKRGFEKIIGTSAPMIKLLSMAKRAADCDLPVVIAGESGTGKELLARAIHDNSSRVNEAFVAINCGAIPEALLESELFGHVRGAFTGADRKRQGLFQVADGGTLFLDEIADTSLAMQSKLLRVLQEGEVRPVGSETVVRIDIRVLCASNKKLSSLVEQGLFREDLFYRLNVLSLVLPPLRDRRGDIGAIAKHVLKRLRPESEALELSPAALRAVEAYHWPGNIRELENELSRACAMADDSIIEACDFSPALTKSNSPTVNAKSESTHKLLLKPQVEELEQALIREAMEKCDCNQSKAAILLGLSRYGLQKKLQRYGITRSARSIRSTL